MDKLLRMGDVLQATGLSRTTIWRLEGRGRFPRRLRVTGGTVAWRASEIAAWIEELAPVPAPTHDLETRRRSSGVT